MDLAHVSKNIGRSITHAIDTESSKESGQNYRYELCQKSGLSLRVLDRMERGDPTVQLASYLQLGHALEIPWVLSLSEPDSAH